MKSSRFYFYDTGLMHSNSKCLKYDPNYFLRDRMQKTKIHRDRVLYPIIKQIFYRWRV